jgi:hypothetical protein
MMTCYGRSRVVVFAIETPRHCHLSERDWAVGARPIKLGCEPCKACEACYSPTTSFGCLNLQPRAVKRRGPFLYATVSRQRL